jgi:uracil-DNA glycosylase
LIFNALNITPLDSIRTVILGQDPYHGPDQAHGLCFSVQKGVDLPPSLKNILKELGRENASDTGDLTPWALQGVLLLNTIMTVERGRPGSHEKKGWEIFTDKIISLVSETAAKKKKPLAFLLWGNWAHKKIPLVDSRHFVVKSAHPSPLSCYRGFLGSRPFEKVNDYLKSMGQNPIDWTLPREERISP